jgi:NADH-quinone oxidoreductase subunit E
MTVAAPLVIDAPVAAEAIETVLDRYDRDPSAIISVLQDLQEEANYLPESALRYVSKALDVPLAKVYSLATFYRAFSLEPRGKHLVHVCLGTACHVRGAGKVLDAVQRELNLEAGETDSELEFTLETVNCLGACALGPVVVVDGVYHGEMTSSKSARLLKRMRRKQTGEEA